MRWRTPETKCVPASRPSGIGRNHRPANTTGIPMSPTRNSIDSCPSPPIHQTSMMPKQSGTIPPMPPFRTMGHPQVCRRSPTRPITNQKTPQAALRASPPVRTPITNSVSVLVKPMSPPAPAQISKTPLPSRLSRSGQRFPLRCLQPQCVRVEEK